MIEIRNLAVIVAAAVFLNAVLGMLTIPSDFGLNAKQLIEQHGYPFQNHTVITTDGYILEIHRIPYGRSSLSSTHNPPVLVVPGMLSSSADFVNLGPKKSLGFILADNGYDVWLLNYRGTTWSRKHIYLNPDVDKKKFWNFSFQDIGSYDLPACIDYVLHITGEKKLYQIGHSQGSASVFALLSENSKYNDKIRFSIGLAPGVYIKHIKMFVIHIWAMYLNQIKMFLEKYQLYELLPHSELYPFLGGLFCEDGSPFQKVCATVFYMVAGYSPSQLNKTMIPIFSTNAPCGSSAKSWHHYSQLFLSGDFSKYDYGQEENKIIYGQPNPPIYNISKITIPIALYSGDKDVFVVKKDIEHTASMLPNVVARKYILGFNHLDVIWGVDVVKEVFNEVIELLKRY